jgi:hypothetical protein
MSGGRQDEEKARYWQKTGAEAARSGILIREFCRRRPARARQARRPRDPASFASVSDEAGIDAGIELVLGGGRRLRIRKGVDEATLRAVLAPLDPTGC